MKEEYFHVRILDTTDPAGGSHMAAWQHVVDGETVGYVHTSGLPVTMPKVYEANLITTDPYFAPGVQLDPNGYVPPSMAAFLAASAAGPDALDALIKKSYADKRKAEGLPPEGDPVAAETLPAAVDTVAQTPAESA